MQCMQYVVFPGSTRRNRANTSVINYIEQKMKDRGHDVYRVSLETYGDLEAMYKSRETPPERMEADHEHIESSDGIIVVSPEYNHAFSGALKNALDHFLEAYAHKPSGIVAYSA